MRSDSIQATAALHQIHRFVFANAFLWTHHDMAQVRQVQLQLHQWNEIVKMNSTTISDGEMVQSVDGKDPGKHGIRQSMTRIN